MGELREGDGFLRRNSLLGVPVHQHQLVPIDGVELVYLRVQLIHTHHGEIQLAVVQQGNELALVVLGDVHCTRSMAT